MATENTDKQILVDALKQAGQKAIESELDHEIELAIQRVKNRRDEIIAGAVLQIVSYANIQRMGEDIVITLKKQ